MIKYVTHGARTLLAKTCLRCGELCQSDQFVKRDVNGNGVLFYTSYCNTCYSIRGAMFAKEQNARMLETAGAHGQLWTDGDVVHLQKLLNAGFSQFQIGTRMGRTRKSIENALKNNRIKRQNYTARLGQQIDVDYIRELIAHE